MALRLLRIFPTPSRVMTPALARQLSSPPTRPRRSSLDEELNPAIPATHAMAKYDVFMDQDVGSQTRIDSYSATGFIINNVHVAGPVALLPEVTLLWRPNAQSSLDLSKESLVLFEMLSQKPGKRLSPLLFLPLCSLGFVRIGD